MKYEDDDELGVKNANVFLTVDTILGMPSSIFMVGLLVPILIYFITKSFLLTLLIGTCYYIIMFSIHKDDVHAFKIWKALLTSKTNTWFCGKYKKTTLIIMRKK